MAAVWYRRLLDSVEDHDVRTGAWRLLEARGWPDNQSCRNLLAWACRAWHLTDLLSEEEFDRDGGELAGPGLFVDMRPGQSCLLQVRR